MGGVLGIPATRRRDVGALVGEESGALAGSFDDGGFGLRKALPLVGAGRASATAAGRAAGLTAR